MERVHDYNNNKECNQKHHSKKCCSIRQNKIKMYFNSINILYKLFNEIESSSNNGKNESKVIVLQMSLGKLFNKAIGHGYYRKYTKNK